MKNKSLWIFTIGCFLLILIYFLNTYIKSNNFPSIKEISKGYIYSNEDRELVIEDSPDNIYEYNVIKYISSKISGDFENVFDELLPNPYDNITINNLKKQYTEGYGAKNIVIHAINTYETLDDLKEDGHDSNRLGNLDIQNINLDINKIVHVLYDFNYTEKSITEDHMTFSEGIKSQHYIINKTNNKILFIEFLGN